ncbi:UNVERIFIED_CONTAM: hypothetical protein PYX00_005086 [Menopon gallinae]|uniref:SEC14-like protein 2 n=1 Tax=Menopon gallinae TaxID=328185 RepID=A0AAW2HQM8_9NEOP
MAPVTELNLSDDQLFALMKFRRNVTDCLKPHHDDHFLLRWLRARNWNPESAEKMLRESLKWREIWNVDEIINWKPPEVIEKYYPSGVCGFDKEGSPVIVVPFAGLDICGMIHSAKRSDFVRQTIKTLETMLKMAREQSEKHGLPASQVVGIIDMEGFNIKHYAWRPAGELVVTLVKMYEANYPEILKACYIINVPKVFAIAFSIIKNFLNEYTISKIQIYKNDPKKWKPVLLKQIDQDQLPAYFGGTMVDANGDPKCSLKIPQGGKIPKAYYFDKNSTDPIPSQKNYITSEIKKGSKLCLDFTAPSSGCILKWEFHTEQHDINFGVLRLEPDGKEEEEVPMHRVKCDKMDEVGILTSKLQATYRVVFDNSYSYLRSKKLYHSIQMLPPLVGSSDLITT